MKSVCECMRVCVCVRAQSVCLGGTLELCVSKVGTSTQCVQSLSGFPRGHARSHCHGLTKNGGGVDVRPFAFEGHALLALSQPLRLSI